MILPIFAIFCCLVIAYFLFLRGGKDARLLQTGYDIVLSSLKEVSDMEMVLREVSKADYKSSLVIHLQMMLVAQMTYMRDILGMLASCALKDPQPILNVVHSIATNENFNIRANAFRLVKSLDEQIAAHPIDNSTLKEIEQIKKNLLDAANVVTPLRDTLTREFGKAGLEWTSL